MFDIEGFLIPIFRCPIRNTTVTIDGIPNFNSSELTEKFGSNWLYDSYCPEDPSDPSSPLDPLMKTCNWKTNEVPASGFCCYSSQKRQIFPACQNDCPGGKNMVPAGWTMDF